MPSSSSLGLIPSIRRACAPVYVRLLFDLIAGLPRQGLTILIVEQNVHNVLRTADRAYVLKNGRIVMQGERPTLYLGL